MNKKVIFSFTATLFSIVTFAQEIDKKTAPYFEKYIIAGNKPQDLDVQTKYENDMRVIVWNDLLIKDYEYSNEAFDKLGYEFVKKNEGDNQKRSKVFRNCSKGIVVEVTEWYNIKLSIAMQWYAPSVKQGVGDLLYCDTKKQTEEEVAKDLHDSFKEDAISKSTNTAMRYDERKNKPVLTECGAFFKEYYYEIIQQNNRNAREKWQIILNKDGSKDLNPKIGGKSLYNAEDRTSYKLYIDYIKNQLSKLIFTNPKEEVWGESVSVTTTINASIDCETKFLGTVKVTYDKKNSSVTIKSKENPAEVKTEELLEYFKNKKEGTYKLSCYNIGMLLYHPSGADKYGRYSFIGYKEYVSGDEKE